ncbi:MAG TPA: hypothetical protein PKD31_16330, partial [Blastocatellia bacterium]|nr:hypothetical protein [Blastocatellia bacterium]
MQFSQTNDVPQLYLASGDGSPASGTLFYLLPANVKGSPATISFADSWNGYAGTYLFLAQPPAMSNRNFANAVWDFLYDTQL